jgi:RHS repeat-associated protein
MFCLLRSFLVAMSVSFITAIAVAQSAQYFTQIGEPNWSATIPIPMGFVNVANGNLHLEIPITSLSQRGGQSVVEKLVYDSIFWQLIGTGGVPQFMAYNNGGWNLVLEYPSAGALAWDTGSSHCSTGNGTTSTYNNFRYTDIHGTTHIFPGHTQRITCQDPNGNGDPGSITSTNPNYAIDGSGYFAAVTNYTDMQVFAPDGRKIRTATDTNGNQYSYPSGIFTDTLGRVPITSDSTSDATNLHVNASDGSQSTYTVHYTQYPVSTNFGSAFSWQVAEANTQIRLPSSLDFPNQTHYTFGYDSGTSPGNYGELTSITLPTGGQVSFGYGTFRAPETNQNQRYVTSISYGSGTWSISYSVPNPASSFQVIATVNGPSRFDVAANTYVNDKTVYNSQDQSWFWLGEADYYNGQNTLLKSINSSWDGTNHAITTTLSDTSQASKVNYTYNTANSSPITQMITQMQEWDYPVAGQPWNPARTTKVSYIQDTSSIAYVSQYHILNRPLRKDVYAGDGTGAPAASTTYTYDEYGANYCSVPMLLNVSATGHDSSYDSSYWARGNATTVKRMISAGVWATSHSCYDTLGNVTQTVDPAGKPTTYDYSDNWDDTSCIPAGTVTRAFATTVTDALGYRNKTRYYTCTGLQQDTQDENDLRASRPGTAFSYDGSNRLVLQQTKDASNNIIAQTSYSYNDLSLPASVTSTALATPDPSVVSDTRYDGFGRVSQTQLHDSTDGDAFVDTAYDGFGRKQSVTNAHHTAGSSTDGTTQYFYDALGRSSRVTRPDGNTVNSTHVGNCTTVNDEVNHARKSCSDGFGRMAAVIEPNASSGSLISGAYTTNYGYDVLDNLLSVNQTGDGSQIARNRTFTYDSLSRLLISLNPESGSINYTYDSAGDCPAPNAFPGDLVKQVDARGIRSCYQYDALHRMIAKNYSSGAPVTYVYDQASYNGLSTSNGIGRRIGMSDSSGQTAWSYDALGNVLTKRQTIAGVTNSIVHNYNLRGSLETLTSPNSHVYTYTYNPAGRQFSLSDNGSGVTYAQNAHYAPPGQLTSATHGLSLALTESNSYNNRLQPVILSVASPSMTLMSLSYGYDQGSGANNGDVVSVINNRDNTRSTAYTYDALNRLNTARTSNVSTWGDSYVYDPFGNLLQKNPTQGTAESLQITVDANNRINSGGYGYDVSGNMIVDGSNQNSVSYDAENHLTPAGGTVVYTYDGEGRRVQTVTGDGATQFWYDDEDKVIATTGAWQRDYVYFNDRRLAYFAPSSGNQHYYWSDHLGSASVMSNSDGSSIEWEADYYPFGTKRVINDFLDNFFLFTGYQFDYELGYNYAGAREQSPNLGRFLSPDAPFSDQQTDDPQSWNLYSYARNNPVSGTDPDGRSVQVCTTLNGTQHCTGAIDNEHYNNGANGANGGLKVPSLSYLQEHGSGDITDANGNVVGTASYTPDNPGIEGAANMAAARQLASAGATLSDPRTIAGFYGASALAGGLLYASGALGGAEGLSILIEDLDGVLSRAASAVGNQGVKVASREVAEEAAKKWVGEGARAITDRATGRVVGEISADGTRVARFTSAETKEYINLVNKLTRGNLHVGW